MNKFSILIFRCFLILIFLWFGCGQEHIDFNPYASQTQKVSKRTLKNSGWEKTVEDCGVCVYESKNYPYCFIYGDQNRNCLPSSFEVNKIISTKGFDPVIEGELSPDLLQMIDEEVAFYGGQRLREPKQISTVINNYTDSKIAVWKVDSEHKETKAPLLWRMRITDDRNVLLSCYKEW